MWHRHARGTRSCLVMLAMFLSLNNHAQRILAETVHVARGERVKEAQAEIKRWPRLNEGVWFTFCSSSQTKQKDRQVNKLDTLKSCQSKSVHSGARHNGYRSSRENQHDNPPHE